MPRNRSSPFVACAALGRPVERPPLRRGASKTRHGDACLRRPVAPGWVDAARPAASPRGRSINRSGLAERAATVRDLSDMQGWLSTPVANACAPSERPARRRPHRSDWAAPPCPWHGLSTAGGWRSPTALTEQVATYKPPSPPAARVRLIPGAGQNALGPARAAAHRGACPAAPALSGGDRASFVGLVGDGLQPGQRRFVAGRRGTPELALCRPRAPSLRRRVDGTGRRPAHWARQATVEASLDGAPRYTVLGRLGPFPGAHG